jgi:hypothetical protein
MDKRIWLPNRFSRLDHHALRTLGGREVGDMENQPIGIANVGTKGLVASLAGIDRQH